MATNQNNQDQHSSIETVEIALSKTEKYIEDNKKSLSIIALVLLALVGIYVGYKNFILAPKEKEAQSQMFVAERYFESDSFQLALDGYSGFPGFLEIIDEYGITESANLSYYYAGICYLRLGDFENAIEYLEGFDANDKMIAPIAMGAIGDAYVELDQLEKAVGFYNKAANENANQFTAPIYLFKLGQLYEKLEKYDKALNNYKRIEKDYPMSSEGRNIEKYIALVELKIKG